MDGWMDGAGLFHVEGTAFISIDVNINININQTGRAMLQ